jgi:hypothetical protein
MYARLARFEGSDPEVLKREIEDMRKQIQAGMSDESMREMNEQTGGRLDQAQMETLRKTIKRTLVLADQEKGSSAMVIFCDSEDDVRRVDEMFNQMSPSSEGGGKRQSVEIYEVAIDEQTGG